MFDRNGVRPDLDEGYEFPALVLQFRGHCNIVLAKRML